MIRHHLQHRHQEVWIEGATEWERLGATDGEPDSKQVIWYQPRTLGLRICQL